MKRSRFYALMLLGVGSLGGYAGGVDLAPDPDHELTTT